MVPSVSKECSAKNKFGNHNGNVAVKVVAIFEWYLEE
jgi:hypothetical protein